MLSSAPRSTATCAGAQGTDLFSKDFAGFLTQRRELQQRVRMEQNAARS
jgi:hypothetical protein